MHARMPPAQSPSADSYSPASDGWIRTHALPSIRQDRSAPFGNDQSHVSAALRSGVDPKVMIDQLGGIRCLSAAVARKANKEVDVLSCPDAIARALEEALVAFDTVADITIKPTFVRICEECGEIMRWEANCAICDRCGNSKCG